MCAGHLPHEQDDGHHHQPRCGHGRATTDGVGEGLTHHPSTGGDKHQKEGSEQFGEQSPPLLLRILEVRDRLDNLHLEPSLEASRERLGLFLSHHASRPPARISIRSPDPLWRSGSRRGTLDRQRQVGARQL